jgi:hypothetical protein
MEPLSDRCYPSNFFDPFGDEGGYEDCAGCGGSFWYEDLTTVGGPHWKPTRLCPDCWKDYEPEEE